MKMLDHLLEILSPSKESEKTKLRQAKRSNRWLKKSKKSEKKPIIVEKKPYLEAEFLRENSTDENLLSVVSKPQYVDTKEWIATHTISLFHNINLIYGTISEYCTAETCPLMQGPCQTNYVWVEERGKKLKCTAAQYIDYVMTFCQKSISNQKLFPTKYASVFEENFEIEMKRIHRFLFHVISHLYFAHSVRLLHIQMHHHLNTVFRHFFLITSRHQLLEARDFACLDDLIDAMKLRIDHSHPSPSGGAISFTSWPSSAT